MMKYKTIDLCAGIGGIRRGFELTERFENVLSAEIDDFACATYELNFGDNPKNDLTSEEFKQKVVETEYDILLAGFPCQTFSRAGKQLGFRDTTKGTIFFDIADIISRTNPKAVFLENVENLVSHDKGQTIDRIIHTLEDELGYRVIGVTIDDDGEYVYSSKTLVRNSRYFGIPQNRPRTYLIAFSKHSFGDAVKVLPNELPHGNEKTIFEDVNAILEPDVDAHYYMASGYLQTLKDHKARQRSKGYGFGYCVVNEPGIEHPVANTILATGGSGKERNLVYQPREGIAGINIATKKTPINDEGIRVMTPKEWGRLQGFIDYGFMENGIDTFRFPDTTTDAQKYKQFGNSVTIPVIETMAEFMLNCFKIMADSQIGIIFKMAKGKDFITKRDVIESLRISTNQANYLLKKMVLSEKLEIVSHGRYSKYRICEIDESKNIIHQ